MFSVSKSLDNQLNKKVWATIELDPYSEIFYIVHLTVVMFGSCLTETCSETERGTTTSKAASSEAREAGLGFSSPTRGSSLAGSACWLLPGWLLSMEAGPEGTATLAPPTAP